MNHKEPTSTYTSSNLSAPSGKYAEDAPSEEARRFVHEAAAASNIIAATFPSVDAIEAELGREKGKHTNRSIWRTTIFALVVAAAVAVLIAVLVIPVLEIEGASMTDTLQDGDIVVAMKTDDLNTGDVVAFYYNNNVLVKRVIAKAGDWVDIDKNGNVTVNGQTINEPYVTDKSYGQVDIELPYQVRDGRIFVMGDHRSTSIDSRNSSIGDIDVTNIVGKVVLIVWPLSDIGILE